MLRWGTEGMLAALVAAAVALAFRRRGMWPIVALAGYVLAADLGCLGLRSAWPGVRAAFHAQQAAHLGFSAVLAAVGLLVVARSKNGAATVLAAWSLTVAAVIVFQPTHGVLAGLYRGASLAAVGVVAVLAWIAYRRRYRPGPAHAIVIMFATVEAALNIAPFLLRDYWHSWPAVQLANLILYAACIAVVLRSWHDRATDRGRSICHHSRRNGASLDGCVAPEH